MEKSKTDTQQIPESIMRSDRWIKAVNNYVHIGDKLCCPYCQAPQCDEDETFIMNIIFGEFTWHCYNCGKDMSLYEEK